MPHTAPEASRRRPFFWALCICSCIRGHLHYSKAGSGTVCGSTAQNHAQNFAAHVRTGAYATVPVTAWALRTFANLRTAGTRHNSSTRQTNFGEPQRWGRHLGPINKIAIAHRHIYGHNHAPLACAAWENVHHNALIHLSAETIKKKYIRILSEHRDCERVVRVHGISPLTGPIISNKTLLPAGL